MPKSSFPLIIPRQKQGFFWGNSTSRTLFELILRLRKVEMDQGLNLKVIHVAGTPMIEQGRDGGSKSDLT
jgi:hypothetical protein